MQARNQSSVLFSLHELRSIEQQRVADEHAVIARDRDAKAAAKLAAERAVVEAEEARIAAERAERMRIEQARADAERELRLQIESKEAGERARLAAALEQERMQQELELRRAEILQKRPRWMLAVTGCAIAAAIALTWFGIDRMRDAAAARGAEQMAIEAKDKAKQDAADAQKKLDEMRSDLAALEGRVDTATRALEVAQGDADREKARIALAEARKERADAQHKIDVYNAKIAHDQRVKTVDVSKCAGQALGCIP
jgi:hypothetical protein